MHDFFTWDEIMRDLAVLAAIFLLVYISNNVTPINIESVTSGQVFVDVKNFIFGKISFEALLAQYLVPLENIFGTIAIVFVAGIFWVTLRAMAVHHKEHEAYAPIHLEETVAKEFAVEWQVVLGHVNSENPAEWKIAILEADNMLDGVLDEEGYVGDTVADKLKAMSPSRIASYNDLWEAHKVRNEIAHGGAIEMDLSKKMARDTVARFENAFRDLGYL